MHIRHAKASDIEAIKALADANKSELGFVTKPALLFGIGKGWLLVAEDHGVVGFVHYRHRRDSQSTIYEICVAQEHRGQGIGRLLVDTLANEARLRGKAYIQLKAVVGLPSNRFYQQYGFELVCMESGKKRALNVWRYDVGPRILCLR